MNTATIEMIQDSYPDVDWARFFEADQALNWELWHGPLPSEYWTDVEPLEHYTWKGCERAENDIREMLDGLPAELFYNVDAEFISERMPEDEDYSEWSRVDPRQIVMHKESWKQCF